MMKSIFNCFFYLSSALLFSFSSYFARAEITFPDDVFESLDYGIYWFDYADAQKAEPHQINSYYDPNKPTVIFTHGWQSDTVTNRGRETLDRHNVGGPSEDLSHYWLDQGWNVGIFYWNQMADEKEVKHAEAKVHTVNGPKQIRWKNLNGDYASGPAKTVAQLFFEAIRDNMADFNHSHLRLAGHSLGSQLVLATGKKLHDAAKNGGINSNLAVDRIALLDPFFSNGAQQYLGNRWPGEVSRAHANELREAGVAIETYRSSPVASTPFVGDENRGLINKTAFSELKPWNFAFWQLLEKHLAAVTWYFWSKGFETPQLRNSYDGAPSASANTARIIELMNANYGVIQRGGAYSGSPEDDSFRKRRRL